MGRLALLIGGQKSGKSSTAAVMAAAIGAPVVIIAPAEVRDPEFAERVDRHRADRPSGWRTIESFDLDRALEVATDGETVIIDALDTWLLHAMEEAGLWTDEEVSPLGVEGRLGVEAVLARVRSLALAANDRTGDVIVVAGQPGLGPHLLGAGSRRYVDLHGQAVRHLADAASTVQLVVAGRALPLSRTRPAARHALEPIPSASHPGLFAEALRLTAVAFQFLTRVPVRAVPAGAGDLRRATAAFPLVGLAVAAVGVAARGAVEPILGPVTGTVAALAAMVAFTGSLHEDGLADTADGVWGGWDRRQRLEIMRDSRIGTYGVVALVTSLGVQLSVLAPLDIPGFARAAVCGHVLGRASTLVMAHLLPVASPGSGAQVSGPAGLLGTLAAGLTVGAAVIMATGRWAPVPVLVALVVIAACRRMLARRLGGLTGDALGATNQAVQVVVMAAVAALVGAGLV